MKNTLPIAIVHSAQAGVLVKTDKAMSTVMQTNAKTVIDLPLLSMRSASLSFFGIYDRFGCSDNLNRPSCYGRGKEKLYVTGAEKFPRKRAYSSQEALFCRVHKKY